MLKRFLMIWALHGLLLWAVGNSALDRPGVAAMAFALGWVTAILFSLAFVAARSAFQLEDPFAFIVACAMISIFATLLFQRWVEIDLLLQSLSGLVAIYVPSHVRWEDFALFLAVIFAGGGVGLWIGRERKITMSRAT